MNKTISFLYPVQDEIRDVEALLRAQSNTYHPDLSSALDHLVASGGKRIRPALTLLAGRMLGADKEALLTLAASIELLHTATLVHDDLIDGSLLRRGMPTLNSEWTPGATVLTGDFLFARAAKLAADTESLPVIKLFAETLAIIVNGEITQMFASQCQVSREDYNRRIYAKTASLFETAAKSAALVSRANANVVEALQQYGYEIGMAFQIVDDILDFTGDQATIGKPVGSDLRNGLVTLPALYYLEAHPDDPASQRLLEGKCLKDESQLEHMIHAIRGSQAIQAAHREAIGYVQRGISSLRRLPDHPERQSLEELAAYIVERDL